MTPIIRHERPRARIANRTGPACATAALPRRSKIVDLLPGGCSGGGCCNAGGSPAGSLALVLASGVIVEVLSESTASADRGDKFADYRRLKSLKEYVLVSQRERTIDVYRRDGRRWIVDSYGAGETLKLESIATELAVDDVYTDPLGAIVR